MKKILSIVLSIVLMFSCIPFSSADLSGDVDGNGKINSSDALIVLQYSVGQIKTISKARADVNGDGNINSSDALIVLQISVGMITLDQTDSISGIDYDVPAYCVTAASLVAEKINNMKNRGHKLLIFGAITDNHINLDSGYVDLTKQAIKHANYALSRISNLTNPDFLVNLGDNNWATTMDTENSQSELAFFNETIGTTFSNYLSFRLIGNHDTSKSMNKVYSLIGSFNQFDKTGATPQRCYGYKDFYDKKVRVICINTCDYNNFNGGYGMSYEQKKFIADSLDLSDKADMNEWQILLLSHIPLDFNVNAGYTTTGDYNTRTDIKAILDAYVKGSSVTISVNPTYVKDQNDTVTSNFTKNYSKKNGAKIIANIHGHLHMLTAAKMEDNDIYRICTPNSCYYNSYGSNYGYISSDGKAYAKSHGSAADTSVTFYVIDLTSKSIDAFCYGAGYDRKFFYTDVIQ